MACPCQQRMKQRALDVVAQWPGAGAVAAIESDIEALTESQCECATKDAEIERLREDSALLRHEGEAVAVLKERLKIAEETICSAKRDSECMTAEDWKSKAMYYEYQWRCCSEFANRRIGELAAARSNVEPTGDQQPASPSAGRPR